MILAGLTNLEQVKEVDECIKEWISEYSFKIVSEIEEIEDDYILLIFKLCESSITVTPSSYFTVKIENNVAKIEMGEDNYERLDEVSMWQMLYFNK